MTRNFLFFFLALLLSSCSFFSKKVESLVEPEEKAASLPRPKKNLHCNENSRLQLMLEDESTIKFYRPLLPSLFESKNFSFAQKAVMLSLIEMSRRPDEASPSARMQFFIRLNGKLSYFDFRPMYLDDDSKMSYIKALDTLLKNFNSDKNLSRIAEILDQTVPQGMNVGPGLESFLQTYKVALAKNETLAETFFKGDDALTKHETFKRISYKKVISTFYAAKLAKDELYDSSKNSLFPIDVGMNDLSVKCNADINKENNLKDDIINSSQKKSHYFALKDGEDFFIAVSSATLDKPFKNFDGTYLLKTRPAAFALPVCQFSNKQEDIILFSTSGRNPAQHLKHLVTYDINLISSYQGLEELLNFSRHLFISGPDRILYESKRGRKSQLNFFLSMNFPIYHVDSLGDIIGTAGFKTRDHEDRSLIVDDRSTAKLWCSP